VSDIWPDTTILSPSREATPLITPDIRHTEILKYYYFVPLKRGHPSYQARYQRHQRFKKLTFLSLSRKATPLIRPDIRHTEILKYYYFVPLKRGHPSYQARYQTH
jgi:hypothetical protein